MLQSLLLILVVIFGCWGYLRFKRLDPAARRRLLWRSAAGALILVLITMAITGRLHWLFALIGALLPFVRGLLGIGLQLLPLWLQRRMGRGNKTHQSQSGTPPITGNMTPPEAMEILGLSGDINSGEITRDMVNQAHKRLIQKVHPDRGGNDYLAAKINQARDVLLKILEK